MRTLSLNWPVRYFSHTAVIPANAACKNARPVVASGPSLDRRAGLPASSFGATLKWRHGTLPAGSPVRVCRPPRRAYTTVRRPGGRALLLPVYFTDKRPPTATQERGEGFLPWRRRA